MKKLTRVWRVDKITRYVPSPSINMGSTADGGSYFSLQQALPNRRTSWKINVSWICLSPVCFLSAKYVVFDAKSEQIGCPILGMSSPIPEVPRSKIGLYDAFWNSWGLCYTQSFQTKNNWTQKTFGISDSDTHSSCFVGNYWKRHNPQQFKMHRWRSGLLICVPLGWVDSFREGAQPMFTFQVKNNNRGGQKRITWNKTTWRDK